MTRIAFVSQPWEEYHPPTSGSIALWSQEIGRRLAQRYQVSIFSPAPKRQKQSIAHYEGMSIHYVPRRRDKKLAQISRFLKERGWLRQPYYWQPGYYASYIGKVAKILKDQAVDIVHVHNLAPFLPILRRTLPNAKLILHMHCNWLSELASEQTDTYLQAADLVACCSHWVEKQLATTYPNVRTATFYNAVTPFQLREEHEPYLLYVGRMSPEKGVHVLVEAFAAIASRTPNLTLKLIGPNSKPYNHNFKDFILDPSQDPETQRLQRFYPEDYIRACLRMCPSHLQQRVQWLGALPHEDLAEHYARARAVVVPSVWEEPFGRAVVEAWAGGRPVLATRSGGMTELIEDGKTGLLADRGNVKSLQAALDSLIESPQLCDRLGRQGRAALEARFTWDHLAAEISKQYDSLCPRSVES